MILNVQSVKHTDTFKYLGVELDDTLSFNDHVDYVRMKVSRLLRMFTRIRPLITLEAANRLYKAMVLPVQPRSQGLSSNRPLGRARRDPGLVWSRVCQILAGYK